MFVISHSVCSLDTEGRSYQGAPGTVPEPKSAHASSQGPTLQEGLVRESRLRPAVLLLCCTATPHRQRECKSGRLTRVTESRFDGALVPSSSHAGSKISLFLTS